MLVPSAEPKPIEIQLIEEIELTEEEILADLLYPAPPLNGSSEHDG
jgi:hypothetical protein